MTSLSPSPMPPPSAELREEEEEPPSRIAHLQSHIVHLQTESPLWKKDRLEEVQRAAEAALDFVARRNPASNSVTSNSVTLVVSILCTNEQRMRALNRRFRDKDTACDSLAFPAAVQNDGRDDGQALCRQNFCSEDSAQDFLGDIALGYQGLQRAIDRHRLDALAHSAHMTVHGILHLAGFTHDGDEERSAMEEAEGAILARLGFTDLHPLALP